MMTVFIICLKAVSKEQNPERRICVRANDLWRGASNEPCNGLRKERQEGEEAKKWFQAQFQTQPDS